MVCCGCDRSLLLGLCVLQLVYGHSRSTCCDSFWFVAVPYSTFVLTTCAIVCVGGKCSNFLWFCALFTSWWQSFMLIWSGTYLYSYLLDCCSLSNSVAVTLLALLHVKILLLLSQVSLIQTFFCQQQSQLFCELIAHLVTLILGLSQ